MAWAISLALMLAVGAVFGQTGWFGFIDYDDPEYVTANPIVQQGLTLAGAQWAVTFGDIGPWHPLTWISLMLDDTLYGMWAGGYHLTNVALHAAAAALLFLALRRMTGAVWRSAVVAAVFAVHPLRAESVAWVVERKDVLSGVFFMLLLLAYARYVEKPTWRRSLAVTLCLGAGLLSKAMLVTAPAVLLLLDYWPLRRWATAEADTARGAGWRRAASLVLEKAPLWVLVIGASVITLRAPDHIYHPLAWPLRLETAIIGPIHYLKDTLWPTDLLLPHMNLRQALPTGEVALALALLAGISIGTVLRRRKYPHLFVGWWWFLGMLAPVVGIIPSRIEYADRYTYLPQIGLTLAATWGLADWAAKRRVSPWALAGAAGLLLLALGALGWRQTAYWENSERLWTRMVALAPDDSDAQTSLGEALLAKGALIDAMAHLQTAITLRPTDAEALDNAGCVELRRGRYAEAGQYFQRALTLAPDQANALENLGLVYASLGQVRQAEKLFLRAVNEKPEMSQPHYSLALVSIHDGHTDAAEAELRTALRLKPDYAEAYDTLGGVLARKGQMDAAQAAFEQAITLQPQAAEPRYHLASVLMQKGKPAEAAAQYAGALARKPDYAEAHLDLGWLRETQGRYREALAQYRRAAALQPEEAMPKNNLAWVLATCPDPALRDGLTAVKLATEAYRLTAGADANVLETLAAAYAEHGQYTDAMQAGEAALKLAEAAHNAAQAQALRTEMAGYAKSQPWRAGAKPVADSSSRM
jgi:tetratricopeptide (TPR) repeat protein